MMTFATAKTKTRRQTDGTLPGGHGRDRNKALIVELRRGDLIAIKPFKTRRWQVYSVFDIYQWMVRTSADNLRAEKRDRKKSTKTS